MSKNADSMTCEALYETLRSIHEPKGFFFNEDTSMVLELLKNLLSIKETYGYMACPCRLSAGVFEKDKDIICPCIYREADVKEYGTCFCGLYVSKAWNEGRIAREVVPERRPANRIV